MGIPHDYMKTPNNSMPQDLRQEARSFPVPEDVRDLVVTDSHVGSGPGDWDMGISQGYSWDMMWR